MNYWQAFWTMSLLVAGVSFACITVIVTARGFRDLHSMFDRLRRQKDEGTDKP
jgi:hypothetical protein